MERLDSYNMDTELDKLGPFTAIPKACTVQSSVKMKTYSDLVWTRIQEGDDDSVPSWYQILVREWL